MTSVYEIRLAKVRSLIERRFDGVQAKFALAIGRQDNYVSRVLSGTKRIGEDLARDIERRLGLDAGGLDVEGSINPASTAAISGHSIRISDATASMGAGAVPPMHESIIGDITVGQDWIRSHLPAISSPSNLGILTAVGDSMSPTFRDGDMVIVDRGIRDVRVDAIYVFLRGSELFLKRVKRRINDGALIVRSDNPLAGPDDVLTTKDLSVIAVLGRVVYVWRGEKA